MKNTIDSCKVKAGECGAIEVVVNVMKTHINNLGICSYGCVALGVITYGSGKCFTDNLRLHE